MMEKTIYVPDIECESCVKVLTKTFEKLDGIEEFEINQDHLIICLLVIMLMKF